MTPFELYCAVRDACKERTPTAVAREAGVGYPTLRRYLLNGPIRNETRARLLRWAERQGHDGAAAALQQLGEVEPPPQGEPPPQYRPDHLARQIEDGGLPLWGSGA